MVSPARKVRGRKTEHIVADWFKARGWALADAVGAGRSGADIIGIPVSSGVHIEVKARAGFAPLAWLRQTGALAAAEGEGGLPGGDAVLPDSSGQTVFPPTHSVTFRCNGQGPASISQFGVLMTLKDYTQLLRESGRL